MDAQPYISGLRPAEPGPLSRFLPALEEGVVSAWLPHHAKPSTWLLDPFGFSPRLVLEAARAGYRVLVTANNPITRFLLEMSADPPAESDFRAALADLSAIKKGDERLGAHLQSLYLTSCEKCRREVYAESFLWRKGEDAPFGRVYKCKECGDSGERLATPDDVERAKKIASTDALHRSRAFERVATLDSPDRVYAEEAIQHYLPRPLYVLTTIINRLDSLNLSPERKRALTALILAACDAGNTLWGHPSGRPRPKQLNIPSQFREQNVWMTLEGKFSLWTETGAAVPCVAWPNKLPESGGICIYEGRLSQLAHEVKKEIPIAAVIGSLPRPNQAFWTLSALWAGWLWGREAAEPFKIVLRRRRYDWAWNATALHSAFTHLLELLPIGTPFLGLLPEPEPAFLTSVLTAAHAAGYDLKSVALRTEHDPVQIIWWRGESLKRESNEQDVEVVRKAIEEHLSMRGEPASYLHVHAAGLIALAEARALKAPKQEFDEAMRTTQSTLEVALKGGANFVHYSSGEGVDTGLWSLQKQSDKESLADRVEVAIVTFLQKNPDSIYLEIEGDLNPRLPGLLTPSKGLIYAVLNSYAEKQAASWKLRAEDNASARRAELNKIAGYIESIGQRLDFTTSKQDKILSWQENNKAVHFFYLLASALIGRALTELTYPPEQSMIVIPGGRAGLVAYKAQRDPSLAERVKAYRVVKYRLLRSLSRLPILTRETFEEQITSDPVEQSKGQMMMF
jgi:hypothetical protein